MRPQQSQLWSLDSRALSVLTCLILALACSVPLCVRWLPMTDLPQLVAVSRMLVDLNAPQLDFARWYELAPLRSPMWLPLLLTGWIAKLGSPALAARAIAFLSVASYPVGLCVLLRALGKPIALALLAVPLLYASPFFLGLVPSSLSVGLALFMIALVIRPGARGLGARIALPWLGCIITLTHPLGLLIVIAFAFILAALARGRRQELQLPWLSLVPLGLGAVMWSVCALRGEGAVGFSYPSLSLRVLRFSDQILGGFAQRGEGYLLAALLVLFVLLRRPGAPWSRARFMALPIAERALFVLVAAAALGYIVLPGSTQSTPALQSRAGWLALAFAPALLPAVDARGLRERTAPLSLALALASTWFTASNLRAFDAEAQSFAGVLQHVPERPSVVGMMYDNRGHVAARAAYLYFAAWAQAERGGLLWLSQLDTDWTIPLRRRPGSAAPPPMFASEWNPALLQTDPLQLDRYDSVLVHGKDIREMTIFMVGRFSLAAQSGKWLLYTRGDGDDPTQPAP